MKIAIIGTGNVGGALATRWSKAGHEILLGVQNTNDFKGKDLLHSTNISVHSIEGAVTRSEVILVATPPQIAVDLAARFGDVSGKIIIDATNSVRGGPDPYPTAYHAFEALTGAEIVKCFNSTGYENMKNPDYGHVRLDMFMAGSSTKAKTVAAGLASDAGFENCYDFGDAGKVELLEKLAMAWINLAIFQDMGRNIGFKMVKR